MKITVKAEGIKVTGYVGQSPEQLIADAKYRAEMLKYEVPQPRLRVVGSDPNGGLIYIDLNDFVER